MPTHALFSRYPSFPSDIPVADIPTLSFTQLQTGSNEESSRLYEACREHGFVLLDLRGSADGEALLREAEKIFRLLEATLTLDQSILNRYACDAPRDVIGYKRSGLLKTEDGKIDSTDAYTLAQDDIMGTSPPRANPEPIESHRQDCRNFFAQAFAAVSVVLNRLDENLDLKPGTLAALCAQEKPSATALRMLLNPAQSADEHRRISLGGHTDIGTISMLFNIMGGLQVLPPGAPNTDSNWRYIKPQEGCAVINVGDTLTEWTGGLLRSSLHRVVLPPGEQAQYPRQSLGYFVRAERVATVQRLKGGRVIPPLGEDEEEDTRTLDAWAAWRAQQIMDGQLKPQSRGGK